MIFNRASNSSNLVRFLNTRPSDYVLYNPDNERSSLNENFIHLIDYPI